MHYNDTKQDFVFCNSPTPSKVIAFASETMFKKYEVKTHIGMQMEDFAPHQHLSRRHIIFMFGMNLVVFACCEDKSQEGYHRLFTSLVTFANTKNISLNPSSILIDFGTNYN